MFADKPNPLISEIAKGVKRISNGLERFRESSLAFLPTEFINPFVVDIDQCNIRVGYDPPNEASLFNRFVNLPSFYYEYRNKRCAVYEMQLPRIVPADSFHIIPNGCNQLVGFAFIESEGKLIGGADKFSYFINGGIGTFPEGTTTNGDGSNIYRPNSNVFKYDVNLSGVPSIRQRYIGLDGVGYTLLSAAIEYTDEYLVFVNGIVKPPFPLYNFGGEYVTAPWEIVNITTGTCVPHRIILPPPPKDKKKEECKCMCCPGQENNDALLKLVLKRIGSLPASVPDNFAKQNPTFVNIESLAELMFWQMQQLDALLGSFPIDITIEDIDSTKEGNQTEKLSLPNVAEGIAELLGLLITTKRDTQATLITAIKAMGEAGMAKQLGIKTLDVSLANAEFLGYKLEQKEKEIPSLFTPGGANLAETLKEKNVKIITYENNDKTDLQDDLKILKTMAARWNAQNWRGLTGDIVEDLRQKLLGNPEAISENHKENEQGSFNDFTEQAERGFIEVSGITDTVNPWGRPFTERPKIREIGTEKGNYDKDGEEKVK
ncbi:MAG: hypothetical protein V7K98_23975 [Nostoc sp.]|uniref:hypothetical protein n=1 Tax=Nostoc sp. TaxID=1180 RepID=UPI002FF5F73C